MYMRMILFAIIILFPVQVKAATIDKIGALGAVLIEADSGRVLWEKNADKPLQMASTTKIMTAILAIENANMNDEVTVSKSVLRVPEVKMHLVPGEKIKLQNLMYALMLESSNDAAVVIAEHIGGSVEAFCKMMTEKANEIGAVNTIFETPNGLDKGQHHSTANDMAKITRYAIANPKFVKLINTSEATFSSNKQTYTMNNKNRLLKEFDGANGVKTGFTGLAGHCFVGAAKRNDMQLISVVLGSGWGNNGKEQKWIDTKKILSFGFQNYKKKQIITKGLVADYTNVIHSKTKHVGLVYSKNLILPLNDDEKIKIELEFAKNKDAPIKAGDVLGHAKVFVEDKLCGDINLLADKSALRCDFITSLKKILEAVGKVTLIPEF